MQALTEITSSMPSPNASLPRVALSHGGCPLSPHDDTWWVPTASARHKFDFDELRNITNPVLVESCKHTILHMLERGSASSAYSSFRRFCSLMKHQSKKSQPIISASLFINWCSAAHAKLDRPGAASTLASFFRQWRRLSHPGLAPDLLALLDEVKLPGSIKGTAVATRDPVKGPFSDLELRSLQHSLNGAYADDRVSLDVFTACWLYLGLGIRPCQLAALKIGDYFPANAATNQPALLRVPRAKQRAQVSRSAYKWRKLGAALIAAVEAQAAAVQAQAAAADKLGGELQTADLPFFPDFSIPKSSSAPGFSYHRTSATLAFKLGRQLNGLGVISERTKQPLQINPYRFRYTLGTRAARMGAGALVVAELLDHSDTQNAAVYVKSSAEALERIDRALALSLAPIAQAFAGQLVASESGAERGGEVESRIYNPEAAEQPLGTCGSYGWCGLWAGVACYTCRQFQPWRDGPHEQVLQWLLHQREQRRSQGGERHMVMLHDQTILAVAEVVSRCAVEETGKEGQP